MLVLNGNEVYSAVNAFWYTVIVDVIGLIASSKHLE
jgi:hypothetical protein